MRSPRALRSGAGGRGFGIGGGPVERAAVSLSGGKHNERRKKGEGKTDWPWSSRRGARAASQPSLRASRRRFPHSCSVVRLSWGVEGEREGLRRRASAIEGACGWFWGLGERCGWREDRRFEVTREKMRWWQASAFVRRSAITAQKKELGGQRGITSTGAPTGTSGDDGVVSTSLALRWRSAVREQREICNFEAISVGR